MLIDPDIVAACAVVAGALVGLLIAAAILAATVADQGGPDD
jgi:hypothetical protein